MQVLQKIRGTMEVDEEFNDICEACVEANKVMTDEHVFLSPGTVVCLHALVVFVSSVLLDDVLCGR